MITFRKENNLLILSYSPERSEWIYDKINSYSGDMHPPKKQICLYFMT